MTNNNQNNQKRFDWLSLIIGVLLLIVGYIAFINPERSLVSVAFLFGIMGIIRGVYLIYFQRKLKDLDVSTGWIMLLGIINIAAGILILVNWRVSILALPIAFAIWFLADSIADLFVLPSVKKVSNRLFWLKLIVDVLSVILGVMLLLNPVATVISFAYLISFYFVIRGIESIISAFGSI